MIWKMPLIQNSLHLKYNEASGLSKRKTASKLLTFQIRPNGYLPAESYWHRSGVFIVNFEHISHLALVFLLLTLSR